jgi:16S rRNA (cytidine1402-2'-O)-methyltransferase
MKGKLYLIPTMLADDTQESSLSPAIKNTIKDLSYFVCENARSARRFVSSLHVHSSIESLNFDELDKDTSSSEIPTLLMPLLQGKDMGLLSDAGCPAIADPGAMAVAYAHQQGIKVVPLVGPSSMVLALMASGLNGQQFAFHGYLPVDSKEAGDSIRNLERESKEKNQTQLFIETPYRNNQMLANLLRTLHPNTRLCLAINLTARDESIICQSVSEWKKQDMKLEKVPVTYLFLA